MKRGLTLIELLVALGLMSMLAAALALWITFSARAAAEFSQPFKWSAAAERALQCIQDDLMCGDAPEPSAINPSHETEPRVWVEDGKLVMLTRERGPARHTYSYDLVEHALQIITSRESTGHTHTRLLLERVREFSARIEDDNTLVVSISSDDGVTLTRRYGL